MYANLIQHTVAVLEYIRLSLQNGHFLKELTGNPVLQYISPDPPIIHSRGNLMKMAQTTDYLANHPNHAIIFTREYHEAVFTIHRDCVKLLQEVYCTSLSIWFIEAAGRGLPEFQG